MQDSFRPEKPWMAPMACQWSGPNGRLRLIPETRPIPISWNEIRQHAVAFAKEWAGVSREDADAKTFWDEFFKVFGIKRRTVASFEEPVKKLSGQWGYIDLFWKSVLLVEHKNRGKRLDSRVARTFTSCQTFHRHFAAIVRHMHHQPSFVFCPPPKSKLWFVGAVVQRVKVEGSHEE
jgi:hypothetical protein